MASLATFILLVRVMPAAAYADYSVLLALGNLVLTLGGSWLVGGLLRHGRADLEVRAETAASLGAFVALSIISLSVSVILLAAASGAVRDVIAVPSGELPLVALWSAAALLLLSTLTLAQLRMDFRAHTTITATNAVVLFGVVALLALARLAEPVVVLTSSAAVSIASAVAGLRFVIPAAARRVAFNRAAIARHLRYSWSVLPGSISTYAVQWVDVLFLRALTSSDVVAGYAILYAATGYLFGFVLAAGDVIYPIVTSYDARGDSRAMRRFVGSTVPMLTFMSACALAAGICLGPPLLPLLFGERARAYDSLVLTLLLAGAGCRALAAFLGPLLSLRGSWLAAVEVVSVIAALTNLGLDAALIPSFGARGAAVASVTAFSVDSAGRLGLAARVGHPEASRALAGLLPVIVAGLAATLLPAFASPLGVIFAALAVLAARRLHRAAEEDVRA